MAGATEITYYHDASMIRMSERREVAAALDRVANEIWRKAPDYWQSDATLFEPDSSLIIAWSNSDPIGFLVYQRALFSFGLVLHTKGINILPHHRGTGLMFRFCRSIIRAEGQRPKAKIYIAARTRSPVVLSICRRVCSPLLPVIDLKICTGELVNQASQAADALLPGSTVELPSMIIRGAYSDFQYWNEPHHRDRAAETAVFSQLGATDAFFVFGEIAVRSRAFT